MNLSDLTANTKKYFIGAVVLAVFFPYISFIDTPFDTQPWSLLLACMLVMVLIYQERAKLLKAIPFSIKVMGLILLYAIILFVIRVLSDNADFLAGLRSLWGYLSLMVMTYVGYRIWPFVSAKLFQSSVVVWFLMAMTQLFLGKEIVSIFLSRFSSGGARGLTSLAPEPAFYANVLVYFLVFNEFFYKDKKYSIFWYFFIILVVLVQLVMSYSGVGMMMLLLFTGAKGIELLFIERDFNQRKKQAAVIFLCLAAVGMFFANRHLRETRAGALLNTAFAQPQNLKNDTSVSGRLINPIIGVNSGILQTHGGGYGIGSKDLIRPPDWLAEVYLHGRALGNRIEGGIPQGIYELGVFGFTVLGVLLYILFKALMHAKEQRAAIVIGSIAIFFPILFFGSLANPLLGLLLGINLFYATKV